MKYVLLLVVMFVGLSASLAGADDKVRVIEISVSEKGYDPATVKAKDGERIALVFTRTSEKGCGQEVVVKGTGARHKLPMNKPVRVEVVAKGDAPLVFTCGMGMLKGTIVVEQ